MQLVRTTVIPIHRLLLIVGLLVVLALCIFALLHAIDIQHIWHTAFISRHGPVTDTDIIHRHGPTADTDFISRHIMHQVALVPKFFNRH